MMSDFAKEWDVEMAMAVMQDPNAEAKLWSDAVRWLLLYGPPEVKARIQEASSHATTEHFPKLKTLGYTEDGQPIYDIKALAESLGISEADAGKKLSDMQAEAGIRTIFQPKETHKIH